MFVWTFVETIFNFGQPGKTLDAIHLSAFTVPIIVLYCIVFGLSFFAAGNGYENRENRKYLYIGMAVCAGLMFYYPFSILLDPPSFLSLLSGMPLSNNGIVPTGKQIQSVVLWVISMRVLSFVAIVMAGPFARSKSNW